MKGEAMFEPELFLRTEVSGADQSRVECFRVSNLIPDFINQSRDINRSSGVVCENGMVNEKLASFLRLELVKPVHSEL